MTRLPLTTGPATRISSRWPSLALFAALSLFVASCGDDDSSGAPPIAEVRKEATGARVTVEGTVTVQPGAFASALGDEGFAVQDSTGGIYVKMEERQTFGLGTRLRVTGTLDEQNRLRILKAVPADVEKLQGSLGITPRDVDTGFVNETVEGQLIRVSGAVTQTFVDDSPYGYKLYVDDGTGEVQIFVHVSAGFDRSTLETIAQGQRVTVVGFAAQYETTYEVAPRMASDLSVEQTIP